MAEAALAGQESRHGHRAQVTVHVDAEVLADPCAAGRCEIEEGAAIAADTMRRLACDADVLATVHGEKGEPLGPGRRTRKVSDRLRRALWERDRGCTFPGCTSQRFLHGHHLHHWVDGGPTHLGNLTSLCRWHHVLVHEGGFSIVERDGGLDFLNPAGERVLPAPTPPVVGDPMPSWRRENARSIDAGTTMPDWNGEHPDYQEMLRPLFERDRGLVKPPRRLPARSRTAGETGTQSPCTLALWVAPADSQPAISLGGTGHRNYAEDPARLDGYLAA